MTSNQVTFQRERVRNVWPELYPLLLENNGETGVFAFSQFEPRYEQYERFCEAGTLHLFTVRHNHKLVGYGAFFVCPHPHAPSQIMAQQDAVYVRSEHRGITGYKFLRWTDEELKEQGVNSVIRQVTTKKDYSKSLNSMGYEAVHLTYMRRF